MKVKRRVLEQKGNIDLFRASASIFWKIFLLSAVVWYVMFIWASTQACKFRVTQTLLGTSVGRVGKSFDTRNRRSFWLIVSLDHNKALCFCFELRKVRNRAYSFLLSCWWTDWTWMKSCTAYPPHAGEKSDRVPGRLAQNQTLSRGRTKYRDFVIFHHGYLQYSSWAFSSVPTNSVGEWKFCKWYLH